MQLFLPERAAANANAHETREAMNAKMCLHYLIQYYLLLGERKAVCADHHPCGAKNICVLQIR